MIHPAVVVSIQDNICTCILLSTSVEDPHLVLCPTDSRFLNDTVFTTCVCQVHTKWVAEEFIGVYEHFTHLLDVREILKDHLQKTL